MIRVIIRATFNDNDYTDILTEYFDRFIFDHYYYGLDDIKDLKEYKDKRIQAEELIEKAVYEPEKMTEEEKKVFIDRVVDSIKVTVTKYYGGHLKDLVNKIDVKIVSNVEDKWENGEVVYYFLNIQKYLEM